MSEGKGDNDDHEEAGETELQAAGQGGETQLEQRSRVTDVLSPAAMTNAYYICHNVQGGHLGGNT